ncbi:phosphate ABC transporter permease PstA [Sphingorhabdus arenilitoris]|uniref:Phosphate transport system permease protein PstA n=1 Tax=Sphingorhabdus arenilitoris TaxID=1490041 RepID=A0ABV8RIF1_9SPHN
MTDTAAAPKKAPTNWQSDEMQRRIAKRYAAETRFKFMGYFAIGLSVLFLAFLLFTMVGKGLNGFRQTQIALSVDLPALSAGANPESLRGPNANATLQSMDLPGIVNLAVTRGYGEKGINYVSANAAVTLREQLLDNPDLITQKTKIWLPAASPLDIAYKGTGSAEMEKAARELSAQGNLKSGFNWNFLSASDATDPADVGIWGALKGSLLTLIVTLSMAFPVGVLAALYLEEYAPKNKFTDLIEVSINNLAAVPSIIFGLLGLVVFLTWFGMPRSSSLVGGLTLALMTMPVIVIAGRNAIKSVPPSIREAAMGIGASPVQVVFHHVLPLALPGILTGTIIGMARALGETAPLLMIGMVAFISSPPGGFGDAATALPVQIFLWSDEVNRGFVEKTSAAIIILLIFLLGMNALAIYLRNKFETRW